MLQSYSAVLCCSPMLQSYAAVVFGDVLLLAFLRHAGLVTVHTHVSNQCRSVVCKGVPTVPRNETGVLTYASMCVLAKCRAPAGLAQGDGVQPK